MHTANKNYQLVIMFYGKVVNQSITNYKLKSSFFVLLIPVTCSQNTYNNDSLKNIESTSIKIKENKYYVIFIRKLEKYSLLNSNF